MTITMTHPTEASLPPPPPSHRTKMKRELSITETISGDGIIVYYSFKLIQKNQCRLKLVNTILS